jgi:hypothetical protein
MNADDNGSFGIFVGIDWADTRHDVCLQAAGTTDRVFEQFSHRPVDIEAWVGSLRQRLPKNVSDGYRFHQGMMKLWDSRSRP